MRRAAAVAFLLALVASASFAVCGVERTSLPPGKLRQFNLSQFPAAFDPPALGRLQTVVEYFVTAQASDDDCMVGLGFGTPTHPAPGSLTVDGAVLTRLDGTEPRSKSMVLPWIAQSRGALLVEGADSLVSTWSGFTGTIDPPGPFPLAAGETFSVAFALSFDDADADALPGLPLQFSAGGLLADGSPDVGPGTPDPASYSELGAVAPCVPTATTLCLADSRFEIRETWLGPGSAGVGQVDPWPTSNSGNFYYFDPSLLELQIKAIDGCGFNQHWWLFSSATSNLGYEVTVTDTATGQVKRHNNPVGQAATATLDTEAFPCLD
jgi:hypothetical protein